jgi:hypothetical protein
VSDPTGTKLGVYLATLEEGWTIVAERKEGRLLLQVEHRDGRAAHGHIEPRALDLAMERLGMADEMIAQHIRSLFVIANRGCDDRPNGHDKP